MNPSYYRITLDVHDATSQLSFSIKQGDTSRRLIITLMDDGVPYEITKGCYAVLTGTKSDGTVFFNDCTISNNTIIYDITAQTSAKSGMVDCEITLLDSNNEQLTSPRFSIVVYATTVSGEEAESTDEYKSLLTLVSEANTVINNIETATKEATDAADDARTVARSVETKLNNGEFKGDEGKSAYAFAQEGGYTGSEEEFAEDMARVSSCWVRVEDYDGDVSVIGSPSACLDYDHSDTDEDFYICIGFKTTPDTDLDIVIASEIDGIPVCEIDSDAFANSAITSIAIPDSVTSIGTYAFSECEMLETAVLGNGIRVIPERMFGRCQNLKSINIPDGVVDIGDRAFEDCFSLKSIIIPESVTMIGDEAFCNCTALTAIGFTGTIEQWLAVGKRQGWNDYVPAQYVICKNGAIKIS